MKTLLLLAIVSSFIIGCSKYTPEQQAAIANGLDELTDDLIQQDLERQIKDQKNQLDKLIQEQQFIQSQQKFNQS